MKKFIIPLISFLIITGFQLNLISKQFDLSLLPDMEKILGEPAFMKDSSTTMNGEVISYNFSYSALNKDEKSGKTGVIYLAVHQYSNDSSAHKYYIDTYNANKGHEGIKVLSEMDDEAYFHSDNENFYFIMARKGEKVVVMKVNKITSKTSLDEFNLFAKNFVGKI